MSDLDSESGEGARNPGIPPAGGAPHPRGKSLRFALIAFGVCVGCGLATALMMSYVSRTMGTINGPVRPMAPAVTAPVLAAPAKNGAKIANLLTYPADGNGHFFIDGAINGAPVRFLVDTGSTFVALSPDDAAAAGIPLGNLQFNESTTTANGQGHVARTTLRSVRIGQLEVPDVSAAVMQQPMPFSLLGMSFLSRVDGYTMRDGVLTIEW